MCDGQWTPRLTPRGMRCAVPFTSGAGGVSDFGALSESVQLVRGRRYEVRIEVLGLLVSGDFPLPLSYFAGVRVHPGGSSPAAFISALHPVLHFVADVEEVQFSANVPPPALPFVQTSPVWVTVCEEFIR